MGVPFVFRTRTSTVLLIAVGLSAAGPPVAAGAPTFAGRRAKEPTWDLAADFRTSPDQANPSPDRFGNESVWTYEAGVDETAGLLSNFTTQKFHVPGLQSWMGDHVSIDLEDRLPAVGIDAAGQPVDFEGIHWPPGQVLVHPLFDREVVVGWHSPLTGVVNVTGSASLPQQPNCGNGVGWSLRHNDAVLRSGTLTGTESAEWNLPLIAVTEGEAIHLAIDSIGGNISCDSTLVSITIEANRTRDAVTSLTGDQEVGADGEPGVGDPDGYGSATILVTRRGLCFHLFATGISLPSTGAHIHQARRGKNGPIVVTLQPPAADNRSSGCVTEVDPAVLADLIAHPNQYYVNIHSAEFPAGAIRGQLHRFSRNRVTPPTTVDGTTSSHGRPGVINPTQ